MADVIRLVKGNSKPDIVATLTDDTTGSAIDLSSGTTTVTIKFRAANTIIVLSIISINKVGGGDTGQVQFDFFGGVLNKPLNPFKTFWPLILPPPSWAN